jgi:hypothetical protein
MMSKKSVRKMQFFDAAGETGIRCRLPSFLDGVKPQYEPSKIPDVIQPRLVFTVPDGGIFTIYRNSPHSSFDDYTSGINGWLWRVVCGAAIKKAITIPGESEPVHYVVAYGRGGLVPGLSNERFKNQGIYAYLPYAGINLECFVSSKLADRYAEEILDCAISLADAKTFFVSLRSESTVGIGWDWIR